MSTLSDFETKFSANRLHGDPAPPDLSLLLANRAELARRTGIVLTDSESWAPWLDTSYLQESDLADPEILANIRAIADVCKFIDFVAEDEDSNYYGYWRGPAHVALSKAPIVCLDNEGQFGFCGTANLAGAILATVGPFDELRSWLIGLGVESLPSGPYDLFDLHVQPSPRQLHEELYEKYAAEKHTA